MEDAVVKALLNYGFGGVLTGVVVLLHIWTIKVSVPKLLSDHRSERKELVEVFRAELLAEREAHDRHIAAIVGRLERVEDKVASLAVHRG